MISVNMEKLVEVGAHLGHKANRRNPKMDKYIYCVKSGVSIINLDKSIVMLERALQFISDVVAKGGSILFVGTKKQISPYITRLGSEYGQFYVSSKWCGGMLTNLNSFMNSVISMERIENLLDDEKAKISNKERVRLKSKHEKFHNKLCGVRNMKILPDAVVSLCAFDNRAALMEAKKLNIPSVGFCDTNSDPDDIDYVVPVNDDSVEAVAWYSWLIANAMFTGMKKGAENAGIDVSELDLRGSMHNLNSEDIVSIVGSGITGDDLQLREDDTVNQAISNQYDASVNKKNID